jgi:hypothetical protein
MTGEIFISYRRDDTKWLALALLFRLEYSFPRERLFLDVDAIEAGEKFAVVLKERIRACDAMLVLIGPEWLTTHDEVGRRRIDSPKDFVHIEVKSALGFGKRVIPVLVEAKTEMPRPEDLPKPLKELAGRQAVRLTHEGFKDDAQRLIRKLQNALDQAEETRRQAEVEKDKARRAAGQARNTKEIADEPLSAGAQGLRNRLAGIDKDLTEAKDPVVSLREGARYDDVGRFAEAISRRDPKDARNRRLYAQYLINTGKATAAIDLLKPVAQRLPKNDPEFAEVMGLIGRANKQIFFDAGDKADPSARMALKQAIAAYRVPFEASPQKNTWHGVNLMALLDRAQRLGLRIAPDLSLDQVAQHVVAELEAKPKDQRDDWYLPTLAEACLGLGDWDAVEGNVHAYAASDDVQPFQIESTLRRLTQVWDIEAMDERGRGVVAILRARLLQLSGGEINATPEEVQQWRAQPPPPAGQLEAVLGLEGPQTYEWWKAGLDRASSVCTIRGKLGNRIGSGFLVKAGALGLQPPDELVVLTNFHIVNKAGALGALTPESAEVAFEARGGNRAWAVDKILWQSPADLHDASVLRLRGTIAGVAALPLAAALPPVTNNAKVYVVGYPLVQELAFSFQENELLDHEGPPGGAPQIPGVSRVHYRAPTEPASPGSPLFDDSLWQVIALHHMGSKDGLARLNGKAGSYTASEGISIASIKAAVERGEVDGH